MAETGVVVVTAPSAKQQPDKTTTNSTTTIDRMSIAHRIASTNPPLQPIHETNQHYDNDNDNITTTNTTTTFESMHSTKHVVATFTPPEVIESSQSQTTTTNHPGIKTDAGPNDNDQSPDSNKLELETSVVSCGSSQQQQQQESSKDQPDVGQPKKRNNFEETIVEGFAICAFKSWEDLQDELNERIASEQAKSNTANEKCSNEKILPKKRKYKPKQKVTPQTDTIGGDPGSLSQPSAMKPKKVKKDKKLVKDKHIKSSSGHSSKPNDTPKLSNKKQKDGDAPKQTNVKRVAGERRREPERSLSSPPPLKNNRDEQLERVSDSNNNLNQIHSSKTTSNYPHGSHTSQSPQVHPQCESSSQSKAQDGMVGRNSPRDQDMSRTAPYSPYGNNPHLNRLYHITSNTHHSMQPHPHPADVSGQSKSQQSSQSQQPNEHNTPQQHPQPRPPQSAQHTQHQSPYQHQTPPHMHPPQSQPSLGVPLNHSYYNHLIHQQSPSPFYYPPAGANPQTPSNLHPPNQASFPPQQQHQYPTNQHHHQHTQPPQYPHQTPPSQIPPSFNMYPPHLNHPQHTSSMMSQSMSMSALPAPYSSPYIITDTTISRQTSIIPPMPTALEQAAASSMASRFGHHPSMIHSMNHYNPATTTGGATTATQSHNHPSSLYQNQLPTERSFMELARSYGGATGGQPPPASSSYQSLINAHFPQQPPPPPQSNLTASPYSLDRWPRMTIDQQRAVSRYNSLYHGSAPTLADRAGTYGGYGMRPPTFPAGMFPPPPF